MKTITKRTAVAALTGIMAAGMLTGCGEKALDGTQTVATVNGTEIPLGVVSIAARQSQAQTEAMYRSFMGDTSGMAIWDTDSEEGMTYGEQAVEQTLENVELMYIMKEKAADYDVEVTEEDEAAIAEAAAAFMEANSEETIADLAVTEDDIKTYLELLTYRSRIYDPIIADVDTEVSDEEAQQSSFEYVSISTADLEEEEIEQKKEDAQKILDALKEDPEGDFSEIAKEVGDSYTSLTGTFDTNETADEEDEESTTTSSYPESVMEVVRTLEDGEIGEDVIETDSAYYVVRMKNVNDEDATETKKESIISTRESDLYTETTEAWMDEAEIKVEDKVLKTLTITDNHKFTMDTAEEETTVEETEEEAVLNTDSELEVADGDTVNIDYVGKIDDVEFDGGSTEGMGADLVIGSGSYIDDFEEQLIGAHPGDEVEVNVTFPEDYSSEDVAGKDAVFEVTVNGIYE